MGVEFPSRTSEQRSQVGNLISFLRGCPETMLELNISPCALVADLSQFEHEETPQPEAGEDLEDPLLDLLRSGTTLQQNEFVVELRRQRTSEDLASV
jgi:hypothetical protein